MKISNLALLLLTSTVIAAAHANTTTVYKSVGKHGETRYSQMQPKNTQNFEVLQMRSDGRTADAGRMAQLPEQPTPPANPEADALKKENEALKNQELTARCQSLRSNFANLSIGGRIYETNAQGEKVYLNDQEISSRRQQHQQMINQYCSGV